MPYPRALTRQLDHFAHELAATAGTEADGNVAVVAERMGMPRKRGNWLLQSLRRELGDQAK